MSQIHESISASVPYEHVPDLVRRYVASLPQTERGEAIVLLKASVGNVAVEREAVISMVPARSYPGFEILEVAWHARDGGPYPVFRGTLCAEQEDVTFCRLDLDGEYDPPGSVVGDAFDAVLGHRVAEAVARELLRTIAAALEAEGAERPAVS